MCALFTPVISLKFKLWRLLAFMSPKKSVLLNKLYLQDKPLAIPTPLLQHIC